MRKQLGFLVLLIFVSSLILGYNSMVYAQKEQTLNKEGAIDFIISAQRENGGFGYDTSTILYTYYAVVSLSALDALDRIDKNKTISYLSSYQSPTSGAFPNLPSAFMIIAALDLLEGLDALDKEKAEKYFNEQLPKTKTIESLYQVTSALEHLDAFDDDDKAFALKKVLPYAKEAATSYPYKKAFKIIAILNMIKTTRSSDTLNIFVQYKGRMVDTLKGSPSLETTMYCVASLDLIDPSWHHTSDTARAIDYILSFEKYEGGFEPSTDIYASPSLETTFYAIISLSFLEGWQLNLSHISFANLPSYQGERFSVQLKVLNTLNVPINNANVTVKLGGLGFKADAQEKTGVYNTTISTHHLFWGVSGITVSATYGSGQVQKTFQTILIIPIYSFAIGLFFIIVYVWRIPAGRLKRRRFETIETSLTDYMGDEPKIAIKEFAEQINMKEKVVLKRLRKMIKEGVLDGLLTTTGEFFIQRKAFWDEIFNILKTKGRITLKDLSESLSVTLTSVKKGINELLAVKRINGYFTRNNEFVTMEKLKEEIFDILESYDVIKLNVLAKRVGLSPKEIENVLIILTDSEEIKGVIDHSKGLFAKEIKKGITELSLKDVINFLVNQTGRDEKDITYALIHAVRSEEIDARIEKDIIVIEEDTTLEVFALDIQHILWEIIDKEVKKKKGKKENLDTTE